MKRASVVGLFALCVGFAGCGFGEHDGKKDSNAADTKTAESRPAPVSETGCLTAKGDQFVLTDLERGEGSASTETFQLVGNDDELRKHVGKQVRITGEAEAPKVAVVSESTPPAAPQGSAKPEATATTGAAQPKVSTETETRMEVRKLTVSSVQPTGASCAAETNQGGAAPTRRRQ